MLSTRVGPGGDHVGLPGGVRMSLRPPRFLTERAIAISFGGTVEGVQQTDSQGRKIYLAALLHPRVFLFGLSILGLGFLLQIISEVTAFF